jgi:serine/threonine protein kinase KIN1/2
MIPVSHSRPSLIKKASKLSFTLNRDKGKEKDHAVGNNKDKDRDVGGRPSGATTLTMPSSDSSSFINGASNHTVVPSQDKETTPTHVNGPSAYGY